jgi:glutamine amidotransferase-like uncharacterized protein
MTNKNTNIKTISISILTTEPLFWTTCAPLFFEIILNNYQWKKNNTTYQFSLKKYSDSDICKGKLISNNIDVLLIPGGGIGDGHSISKGFTLSPRTRKWKKQIQKYIKNGGGCIGICGGASLITSLSTGESTKPTTFIERQYNKSSLEISETISYYKHLALPLFNLFQYKHPENIGTTAYVFSYKPGETTNGKQIYSGGIPIDYTINQNHPIFKDYNSKTIRMRWWGGQALIVPEKTDRTITTIATYPKQELHEQQNTQIHAWKYMGGISGLITGFTKALDFIKNNNLHLSEVPMLTYYFAGTWKPTNTFVKSDLANRPAITTEIYPNKNKGRITLCTSHPEYMIWYDGYIKENTDESFNCLATGFYQWKDVKPFTQPDDYQITHTWWLVRRLIAWTGKVPDSDLPPIEKQKLTSEQRKILKNNIYWNGTLYNQIKNI